MRVRSSAVLLAVSLAVGMASPALAQEQLQPPTADPYEPAAPAPSAAPVGQEATVAERERARVAGAAMDELRRARERLARIVALRDEAEAELAAALAERSALAAAESELRAQESAARKDLGNLARLAYSSGPSEWTLVETFLDANSPQDAMRRATVSSLVAERQDSQWKAATEAVATAVAQRQAAEARVVAAQAGVEPWRVEFAAVQDQVAAIEAVLTGAAPARDGLEEVQRLCQGVAIPQCEPSGWGEGMLTRDAVWLMRVVRQQWPQVREVGGYRPSDPYPDHPSGRAVDVMVPEAGRTARGAAVGDEVAQFFMEHADEYGVLYLIWKQRIWRAGSDPVAPVAQWRMMGDRGDWTSNHYDHVHITVSTGVSGSDIYRAVAAQR